MFLPLKKRYFLFDGLKEQLSKKKSSNNFIYFSPDSYVSIYDVLSSHTLI